MAHEANERISALDGARGLAVLMVIIHHAIFYAQGSAMGAADVALKRFSTELIGGVDLFFVLSGFLITGILLRQRERAHYFRNFYARRTLRIFPLYYVSVLLMCVVLPRLVHRDYLDVLRDNQLWFWAYIANFRIFMHGDWFTLIFDHTWSLAIEEQFYLVWPLVVYLAGARRLIVVAALMGVISVSIRVYMAAHGFSEAQTRVFTPSHCDGLALGAILASLAHLRMEAPALRRLSGVAIGAGIGLRLIALLPIVPVAVRDNAVQGAAAALVDVGFIGFAAFPAEGARLPRWLSTRSLQLLGTYSYGLYLSHLPIMIWAAPPLGRIKAVGSHGGQIILLTVVAGLASAIVSVASFHWFEMPLLKLKARFE